jgi:hypothetical protein
MPGNGHAYPISAEIDGLLDSTTQEEDYELHCEGDEHRSHE